MKLDRKALNHLLSLNDDQLRNMIRSVASESGLDLKNFGITDDNIASIRKALAGATDEDIKKAGDQLNEFKQRRKQ